MVGGGAALKSIAILVMLSFGACASEPGGNDTSDEAAATADADSFDARLGELCAQAAEVDAGVLSANDPDEIAESLDEVIDAQQELLSAMRDLDPPPETAASFDDYVSELETSVEAMERGFGAGGSDRAALEGIVDAAESGVELRQLANDAGLPEECPPGADIDVHNTLFVAEANFGCFELNEESLPGGPLETPVSAKGISRVIDLSRRLSAGIAKVLLGADSPEVDMPVEELVEAQKARIQAAEEVANAFGEAFGVFKQSTSGLVKASHRADKLALSVGLIHCAKVSELLVL